ncbi:aspartic proteinase PCS1 [Dendrobium catenatum]|uniref:Aspartic proteinase PCS1 n=1 Tax=Dendrobium catenatum TaxID=906689 RepID=A0A2I0VXN1_9ASPA|nr:aspartic proteinase PCS1 [Dendrobium catenatum]PKU68171.1 Aspartic proteinase PCS1 [Dendrobium catenatum]
MHCLKASIFHHLRLHEEAEAAEMGSFATASIPILSFLLLSSSHCLETKTNKISKNQAMILPLRTQQLSPPLPLSRPSNKLFFHHNISLTVSLSVGTPPQNVSMVLDTGSELSWLLCNSSSDHSFHPLSSSSFSFVPCSSPTCQTYLPCDPSSRCQISLSYADGSSSDGLLAADLFLLPAHKVAAFGCITTSFSSSASDPTAIGLLGMNQGPLSFITQTSIRRFSYCIPAAADAAGVLVLGDANLVFLPHLNYTPLFEISLPLPYFDRVAYSVQLEGIRVAGELLPIPKSVLVPDHTGAGQTIVDSGTQFTFLLGPAYSALKTEFLRRTKGLLKELGEPDFVYQGAFDACFLLPAWRSAPPDGIPSVALVLPGAEVVVGGERLLYRVAGERRGGDAIWCLTFGNADLVPIEAYVIGHHHQQDLWVEYDLDRSRVGFGPVRCELASQRISAGL